jgi:hypothetical protein
LGVARWRAERESRDESSNCSQASHLQGLDTTGGEDVPPRFRSDVCVEPPAFPQNGVYGELPTQAVRPGGEFTENETLQAQPPSEKRSVNFLHTPFGAD